MSIFHRVLASIGIGSAKVDTLLERPDYRPGDEVRGVVRIYGGQVGQRIDQIYLSVMTQYIREFNDRKTTQNAVIGKFKVSDPIDIRPGENYEVPIAFVLPRTTPLTVGKIPVWIKTTMDIGAAVDPTDDDRIEVRPTPHMETVLSAFQHLGFRFRKAENLYAPRLGGAMPFVQEFEWVPTGRYKGHLDEVELVFLTMDSTHIVILLQIDRRARGIIRAFAETLDLDESHVRLSIGASDLNQGPAHIAELLNRTISKYV
jgi:sporulation-control protein